MKTGTFDFYDSTSLKSYNLNEQIRYQLKIIDSLDVYTRRHSENVASLVCRICEYLHLKKDFIVYCTICAYLHDLGKIFIPPAVLQKNGKLTPEEYEVIKTHTTIGYNMCMEDPKLKPYYAGTLYHHECLDGTGYPNGLKGNKIPYEGQIIHVADEFDAITSKRQYKTHIGIVDTLKILIEHAIPTVDPIYAKIDPKILKALFKVIIDDTEYEISANIENLKYLKKEIKRLQKALVPYNKMIKSKDEENRKFYYQDAKYYLRSNEIVENIPTEIEDLKKSYKDKVEHINRLYSEIKQIKKLKIKGS